MDVNGAETVDGMWADNMCVSDVSDIAKCPGMTMKQVQGVLASSSAWIDTNVEKVNGEKGVDQWLNDWGVQIAFELMAMGGDAKTSKAVDNAIRTAKVPAVADLPQGVHNVGLCWPASAREGRRPAAARPEPPAQRRRARLPWHLSCCQTVKHSALPIDMSPFQFTDFSNARAGQEEEPDCSNRVGIELDAPQLGRGPVLGTQGGLVNQPRQPLPLCQCKGLAKPSHFLE